MRNELFEYARKGWFLFPVDKQTKVPITAHGHLDSVCNVNQFASWELSFKNPNYGIYASKSGLVIVDVDLKHGAMDVWKFLIELNGEPKTLTATTPSGGKHYYFKAEDLNYRGQIRKGIDIKFNGYVLLQPSSNSKGNYKFIDENANPQIMPEWLKKLCVHARVSSYSGIQKLDFESIKKMIEHLAGAALSYQDWVTAGVAIHSALPDETGLDLYKELTISSSTYVSGDEDTAEKKWKGFTQDGGTSILSLAHLCREYKGDCPVNVRAELNRDDFSAEVKWPEEKKTEQNPEELDKDWRLHGDRYFCNNRKVIVDWFNSQGFAYIAKNVGAPFVKVTQQGTRKELHLMSDTALKEFTAPYFYRSKPAYKEWVQSSLRKTFSEIVFRPQTAGNELNLWTTPEFLNKAIKGQKPQALLDLLHESLCGKDTVKTDWVLDWLAHIIQKPGERTSIVPVFISKQGAGKGLLFDYTMGKILGDLYLAVATSVEITSNFNSHLAGRFLTFIDEATWRGNRTEDGILKRLVGSPTITVEDKFKPRYKIDNYSRYAIGSNNEEAVAMELGNRRYVMLEANNALANNLSFFNPIVKAITEGDEVEKFAGFLLERDISQFNPFAALKTEGGLQAKLSTIGPVGFFWYDILFEKPSKIWLNDSKLHCDLAYDAFIKYVEQTRPYEKGFSRQRFWFITKKCIGEDLSDSIRQRIGEERIHIKQITPEKFAEDFCKNLQIKMPDFFPVDLIQEDENF